MSSEANRLDFTLYWVATTLVAAGIAFLWWMSPVGLGFAQWPSEPIKSIVMSVYQASYFVGIPLLIITQGIAAGLAKLRLRRWAFALPAISITAFSAVASFVLAHARLS